jgi:hypothetical protein
MEARKLVEELDLKGLLVKMKEKTIWGGIMKEGVSQ